MTPIVSVFFAIGFAAVVGGVNRGQSTSFTASSGPGPTCVASDCVEQLKTESAKTDATWMQLLNSHAILATQQCGSKQNRLVLFTSGESYCVLYRQNVEQVASEVMSHHVAELLGIEHVPPTTVVVFNTSHRMWRAVSAQLAAAGWRDGHPLLFVPFLPLAEPVHFPPSIVAALNNRSDVWPSSPVDRRSIEGQDEVSRVEQFTELIAFDYLTCNTDRTVSNLHSLQWNDETLSFPVRNAYRHAAGSLVLLDNESAMFHGYRLVGKYGHYYDHLLASSCVFRPNLLKNIDQALSKLRDQNTDVVALFGLDSPNSKWPLSITGVLNDTAAILERRLSAVYQHYKDCSRREASQSR